MRYQLNVEEDCTIATPLADFIQNDIYVSYVISALLCVTLDGQILGRWVFVVDVTKRVVQKTTHYLRLGR